ncbi:MAG: hypothetical protein EOM91_14520 [Sphingobacteriia bacterium]|nr:hypothetical protein [Sphingobacteriia bacterium]
MSTSSHSDLPSPPDAHLTVVADLPAIRIEVLDGNLHFPLKGYGQVDGPLSPGTYRIRWRAGLESAEQTIILHAGEDRIVFEPPELGFRSAAPMGGDSNSRDDQQQEALTISREAPLRLGRAAGLVLYVRDLKPSGKIHPGADLVLHGANGSPLVSLADVASWRGQGERGQASSAGRRMELDPGIYRLRVALTDNSAREMSVAACPGWQTQVFLIRQGGRLVRSDGRYLPDLDHAAVLMVPAGDHYRPRQRVQRGPRDPELAGDDLRLAELARKALAHGWGRSIGATNIKDMLWGKWRDPMLGIFGLHLLLMQSDCDLDTAAEIHDHLRDSILHGFPHPDALALAHEIARRRGEPAPETPPIDLPPMLRRSWAMLVAATARRPDLIPTGSLAATVGDRLAGGDAWLTWRWTPDLDRQHVAAGTLETAAEAAVAHATMRRGAGPKPEINITPTKLWIDGLSLDRRPGVDMDASAPAAEAPGPSFETPILPQGWERLLETAPASLARSAVAATAAPPADPSEGLRRLLREGPERLVALSETATLGPAETSLVDYLSRVGSEGTQAEGALDPLALGLVVSSLGLPAATLQVASASLEAKLASSTGRRPTPSNGEV